MNVGTLSNHVKLGVFFIMWWFSFNYLLVVDLLRFRFRCRVFNSVFFCCLIGDRSSTFSSHMGSFKILPNSFCTSEIHNFMEFSTSQTINDTTNSLAKLKSFSSYSERGFEITFSPPTWEEYSHPQSFPIPSNQWIGYRSSCKLSNKHNWFH